MKKTLVISISISALVSLLNAGVIDPDCTAKNAATSAAAKATVGVGGRCSPAEAAKDTASKAVPDDGVAGKAVDVVTPDKETSKAKKAVKVL